MLKESDGQGSPAIALPLSPFLSLSVSLSLSFLSVPICVWVLKSCRACWPLGRLLACSVGLSPVSFISFYAHTHTTLHTTTDVSGVYAVCMIRF